MVKKTLEELYDFTAEQMVSEFRASTARRGPVAFIMPVGPVEPYPLMAQKINNDRIDLRNCWFFFMDEYCDDEDRPIPETHPLSFRRQSRSLFFDLVDKDLLMPKAQVIFPSPENLKDLSAMIESVGGIEVCYGGMGIHGHVAFNEPEIGVKDSNPRILSINEFTRTIDSTPPRAWWEPGQFSAPRHHPRFETNLECPQSAPHDPKRAQDNGLGQYGAENRRAGKTRR